MRSPKQCILFYPALLLSLLLLISPAGLSQDESYDGLWFLGFNMKKDLFQGRSGRLLRQAFNHSINRAYICREIIGDPNVPSGVIPLGLPGHTGTWYPYAPGTAKKLLASAGFKSGDKKLKGLMLIHTDGIKTVSTARAIKKDLAAAGINVSLKEIPYEENDAWEQELAAGTAALFLMGYKVPPQPFEKNDSDSRSKKFLFELFHSKGEANMFFLQNKELDALIETTEDTPSEEAALKERLMKKAGRMLFEDPVTVNLFYIRELQ